MGYFPPPSLLLLGEVLQVGLQGGNVSRQLDLGTRAVHRPAGLVDDERHRALRQTLQLAGDAGLESRQLLGLLAEVGRGRVGGGQVELLLLLGNIFLDIGHQPLDLLSGGFVLVPAALGLDLLGNLVHSCWQNSHLNFSFK